MNDKKELKKFDPTTIMDPVKDRIKAEFAMLIPDEAWKSMIEKEVQDFFHRRPSESYSRNKTYTRFEQLVHSLLEEEGKKRFEEYCKSPEYQGIWGTNGTEIMSEGIKRFLVDNSGEVFANFIGSMMQNAFSQMRNHF